MTEAGGESSAAPGGRWLAPGRFDVLLTLVVAACFWKVAAGWETFGVRDFSLFSLPNAAFQRDCFWRGQMPWWNPLNCCGLPFLAQFNTLALYPPALFYLIFPLTWALPVFCLAHLVWGGVGMHRLALRWTGSPAGAAVAGVAFAFNGLALNFLMWPGHIATFAWLPWVIWLTERAWREGGRRMVPAALAAALQVLAGGPETILFTWLAVLAFAGLDVVRRGSIPTVAARRLAVIGGLALALSAPQWLPFADFAAHSSRGAGYAGSAWSLTPRSWANFLVPLFDTHLFEGVAWQQNQAWTASFYPGVLVLALAALALCRSRDRRAWVAWWLALGGACFAGGDHFFLFHWLRTAIPFLGAFRYPVKFVILVSAFVPLVAAFAFARPAAKTRRGIEFFVIAAIALLVFLIMRRGGSNALLVRHSEIRLAALVLWAAWIWLRGRGPASAGAVLLTPIFCALDLLTAVPWQNPGLDPSIYQPGFGLQASRIGSPPVAGASRLMLSSLAANQAWFHASDDLKTNCLLQRAQFTGDCNLLDNTPKVDGFYSLYLRDTDRVLWLLDGARGAALENLEDLLGVTQTIAPGKIYEWTTRLNAVPVVSAGQAPQFADDEAAFAAIKRGGVDFHQTVLLPAEARGVVTARRAPDARVTVGRFDSGRVDLATDSSEAAMVVVSQGYYHNWEAKVDGRPTHLWRANDAFQAVEVPAGRHRIAIQYYDKLFWTGLGLAMMAGVACVRLRSMPESQHPSSENQRRHDQAGGGV